MRPKAGDKLLVVYVCPTELEYIDYLGKLVTIKGDCSGTGFNIVELNHFKFYYRNNLGSYISGNRNLKLLIQLTHPTNLNKLLYGVSSET